MAIYNRPTENGNDAIEIIHDSICALTPTVYSEKLLQKSLFGFNVFTIHYHIMAIYNRPTENGNDAIEIIPFYSYSIRME